MQSKPFLEKINQSSVVQQVIDVLTNAMIAKQLRPGDKIPTELELAESLGVGRMSIREAVKVLVYFGVLEIRRPEGTFVREGFSPEMLDPMLYGIILDTGDSNDSLKELREMIEVGTIKMVMRKATARDLELLWAKYDDFAKAVFAEPPNIQAVFDADNAFHDCLSAIGENPMITKINSLVRTLTHDLRYRTVSNMLAIGQGKTLLDAHKDICEVISNKDASNLDAIVHDGYFYDRV
ncbi:MAG: hypothetical protein DELT_02463 [Desulfovibrio sp.]